MTATILIAPKGTTGRRGWLAIAIFNTCCRDHVGRTLRSVCVYDRYLSPRNSNWQEAKADAKRMREEYGDDADVRVVRLEDLLKDGYPYALGQEALTGMVLAQLAQDWGLPLTDQEAILAQPYLKNQ